MSKLVTKSAVAKKKIATAAPKKSAAYASKAKKSTKSRCSSCD